MVRITRKEAAEAYKQAKADNKAIEKMSKSELMGLYYNQARNADIRLRKLEKLSQQETYAPATKWAYARAVKDIETRFGEGSVNWDKDVNKFTKAQIKALLNEVKTFREAPSSTKTGIDKVYKQRAETLNKRYGTNIPWQTMAKLLASDKFTEAKRIKGSDRVFKLIAERWKQSKEIKKEIAKSDGRDTRTVKNDEIVDKILDELTSQGLTFADLEKTRAK